MIHLLTITLFIIGVGYHVMQTVEKLRKKHPEFKMGEIFDTYLKEEWNVLIRSGLVLLTWELFLVILELASVKMPVWWEKYLVVYGLSLLLGYAGQRLIYKYLGSAESVLEKKADRLKDAG